MSNKAMILIVILVVISMSKIASATTITLNETNGGNVADTYISEAAKTSNYGTGTAMHVRKNITGLLERRSWMIWNLSVVPAGSAITNANLSLRVESGNADYVTNYHASYNTSLANASGWTWTETGLIWNNQPALGTLQQNITVTASSSVWRYWNVTNAAIASYSNATNQNMSIVIIATPVNSVGWTLYNTKEYATVSGRPQLVITYTTAPSGTQYNLTGNETMTLTFGATRQLIAKRTGAESMTLALASYKTNTTSDIIYIDNCSTELNQTNKIYKLTADIINTTNIDCMYIDADNITLDCQGHKIDGIDNYADNSNGISTESTKNTTIKNCIISDWWIAISELGNYSVIKNNTISSNGYGLGEIGSASSKLYNLSIYNNLFNNSNNLYLGELITNYWNTTNITGARIYSSGTNIGGNYWTNNTTNNGYSDTCTDSNCDGFCDTPYTIMTDNIDYLPYSNKYNAGTCPNIYKYQENLSMSLSLDKYRKGLFNRTYPLTMIFSASSYRKAILNRWDSLTLTLSISASKLISKFYSYLSTLGISFASNSYRKAVLNRLDALVLTFSETSNKKAILNRLETLTISFASNTYKNALKIYSRLAQLSLTFTDSTYRKAVLNRARTLLITIISGRSVYTPTEKMYETCAVLWKFPRSDRIYLCINNATSYKILIKGTDFHA